MANKLITLHLRLPSEEGHLVEGSTVVTVEREFVESPIETQMQRATRLAAHVTPPLQSSPRKSPEPVFAKKMRECKLQKLSVLGDPVSLKRVLVNLLDNAVKVSQAKGRGNGSR
jgi:signal transduction histidine kinase